MITLKLINVKLWQPLAKLETDYLGNLEEKHAKVITKQS